jgi:hypothetical protein
MNSREAIHDMLRVMDDFTKCLQECITLEGRHVLHSVFKKVNSICIILNFQDFSSSSAIQPILSLSFPVRGDHPPILNFQLSQDILHCILPLKCRPPNTPSTLWFTFRNSSGHFIVTHPLKVSCPLEPCDFNKSSNIRCLTELVQLMIISYSPLSPFIDGHIFSIIFSLQKYSVLVHQLWLTSMFYSHMSRRV